MFFVISGNILSIMSMLDHASNPIVADFNMITDLKNVFG